MDIVKLFNMQKELDERIIKQHGLEGQDLLPQKILALQVELGECANEWRGFKYWSKDQKPRYTKTSIAFADPGGPFEYTTHPLLEEYIDCLHFILSIGLDINAQIRIRKFPMSGRQHDTELILDRFIEAMGRTAQLYYRGHDNYNALLLYFFDLGYMLGFTWEQIEEAYMSKNETNHKRQDTGY